MIYNFNSSGFKNKIELLFYEKNDNNKQQQTKIINFDELKRKIK
jgi:hypothetical protein